MIIQNIQTFIQKLGLKVFLTVKYEDLIHCIFSLFSKEGQVSVCKTLGLKRSYSADSAEIFSLTSFEWLGQQLLLDQ